MEINREKLIKNILKKGLPVVLGAAGGYLYYHYVGCANGTCAITSNPWLSTAYGALIGSVFVSWKKEKQTTN